MTQMITMQQRALRSARGVMWMSVGASISSTVATAFISPAFLLAILGFVNAAVAWHQVVARIEIDIWRTKIDAERSKLPWN